MQGHSQAESLRPRVALLADRDPDTRAMYAEFLKYLGWATLEAANGRDALATVVGQHPAVVILETHLAFIDGLELCRLIRREGEPRPAIVVLTGDVYPAHLEEAQRAGADVVLTKPCLPETLAAELQEVLESSHALRARPGVLTEKADAQRTRSDALLEISARHHLTLRQSHRRYDTTMPPAAHPRLRCPTCDGTLQYERSHVGGVSEKHAEQWDYYVCQAACGTFQYRQRTRKLRHV